MRKIFLLSGLACILTTGYAQTDSIKMDGIFEKISRELQNFRVDTTTPPDDRTTRKIQELRSLRGPFNINEAIEYKLEEEEKKQSTPQATIEKLRKEFQSGNAKRWLDNATIWIYRQHFNYKELKQLVKFYRTSAGAKLATDFPFIMIKTLMAAEEIQKKIVGEQ